VFPVGLLPGGFERYRVFASLALPLSLEGVFNVKTEVYFSPPTPPPCPFWAFIPSLLLSWRDHFRRCTYRLPFTTLYRVPRSGTRPDHGRPPPEYPFTRKTVSKDLFLSSIPLSPLSGNAPFSRGCCRDNKDLALTMLFSTGGRDAFFTPNERGKRHPISGRALPPRFPKLEAPPPPTKRSCTPKLHRVLLRT